MNHIHPNKLGRSALAISIGTGLALTLLSAPAQAAPADRGLFGAQDPTYDGVYRQSLAITGLAADKKRVPKRAVRWLKRQQCSDGGFTAYRANVKAPCPRSDPATYSGPDTNSTAMAAMALRAVGQKKAARKARKWLRRQQNPNGGYPYYRHGTSDANSTGVVMMALYPYQKGAKVRRQRRAAVGFLRTTQLRCEAGRYQRGLLSYTRTPRIGNSLASAQGASGIVGTLPARARKLPGKSRPMTCATNGGRRPSKATSVASPLLHRLARKLRTNRGLPSSFGSGMDLTATTHAATALATAKRSPKAVARASRMLKRQAASYTMKDGAAAPGALGLLLNLTAVTDADSRHFGRVNLSRRLLRSLR